MNCRTGKLEVWDTILGLANPLCERDNCVARNCKSVQDFSIY